MTLILGVTHHNTGLTPKKVLLATETHHKTENIDYIYFRTVGEGNRVLIVVVDTWNNFICSTKM